MLKSLSFSLVFSFCLLAQRSGPLTNQGVGGLVVAGVSEAEVIRVIQTAPRIDFDLRPASTDALLKVGVSEDVIKAMAARESGEGVPVLRLDRTTSVAPASVAPTPHISALGPSPVPELGVYYRMSGEWVEMMPELVNWRVGGVVKTVSTLGVVKPDRNAHLHGGHSKTPLHTPIQLLVYAPEGTQASEYQLIRLRTHAHAREFRAVTGAIFHVHGDSDRDDLPFDSQHVGLQSWTISLSGLKPGEYGLLAPGLESHSASAQLGKMYTFTVVE